MCGNRLHCVWLLVWAAYAVAVTSTSAQDAGQALPQTGAAFQAALQRIDEATIVWQGDRPDMPLDRLLRWGHVPAVGHGALVILSDGTRIVTVRDWAGAGPLRLDGEKLHFTSDVFGLTECARQDVEAIVINPPPAADELQKLIDALSQADPRGDQVWTTTGDRITGKITSCDDDQLQMSAAGGDLALKVRSIRALRLNPLLVSPPLGLPQYAVGFADGSLVNAPHFVANDSMLEIETSSGIRLLGNNVSDVTFWQRLAASSIVYVSDRSVTDYRHEPYLDLTWPLAEDRNLTGGLLLANGQRYLKGLAMHSAARATYQLNEKFEKFAAHVALADSAGRRGSVVFRIFVARDGQWLESYVSPVVRGGDAPLPVEIELAEAQAITLIVDFADRGDELDRAQWLDARLLRKE